MVVEFFKKIGRRNVAEEIEDGIPAVVRQHMKSGGSLVRKEGIDRILELTGHDAELLDLLVGSRLLSAKIDRSKKTKGFYHSMTDEMFGNKIDTSRTLALRDDAALLSLYIEDFIKSNYLDETVRRARTIQQAVNILFARTNYQDVRTGRANQRLDKETIAQWGDEWKTRINSPVP